MRIDQSRQPSAKNRTLFKRLARRIKRTRFEDVQIGHPFGLHYPAHSFVHVCEKKSLSSAYFLDPETLDRIDEGRHFIEVGKSVLVLSIEVQR